jgi:ubiquinol-cytochrome c reductase iron-sulfur subunit
MNPRAPTPLSVRRVVSGITVMSILVLVSACARGGSDHAPPTVAVNTNELAEGHSLEVQWDGQPIVVYRRTPKDIENLHVLDQEVIPQRAESPTLGRLRSKRAGIFVAIMVSPYSSCKVTFRPSGAPLSGVPNKEWLGGFVCPCTDIPYDLAGRTIKPGRFSPSDWSRPTEYLRVPPHHYEGTQLVIGHD